MAFQSTHDATLIQLKEGRKMLTGNYCSITIRVCSHGFLCRKVSKNRSRMKRLTRRTPAANSNTLVLLPLLLPACDCPAHRIPGSGSGREGKKNQDDSDRASKSRSQERKEERWMDGASGERGHDVGWRPFHFLVSTQKLTPLNLPILSDLFCT